MAGEPASDRRCAPFKRGRYYFAPSMETYDLMMLLDADVADSRRAEIIDQTRKAIDQNGGKVLVSDEWGTRKLAYEIEHRKDAVYHLFQLKASPECLAELDRKLKITDGVLRFRTVNQPEKGLRAQQPAEQE